jgi:putative SOS response-associated peptidase YedK
MCGRFTITLEASLVEEELELHEMPQGWSPRYNVAPTQPIPVVTSENERKVEWFTWGLVPSWAKDPSIGSRLINARSETLAEKPSFRSAYQRRRCLILADGFYEWGHPEGKGARAIPYYIRKKDKQAFAFAGLWEYWQSSMGDEILSATIITCDPNSLIKPVHNRMPVMLAKDNLWEWLKPHSTRELDAMLLPYDPEMLEMYRVSTIVNSPENDSAHCILPVE